jgi:hypothetical protein
MAHLRTYGRYPLGTVVAANAVSLAIYASGAALIARLGTGWLVAYLVWALWMEIRVLKGSCVNCAYYGKRCAFGKGVVCGEVFRRGSPDRFIRRKISWKDLLPDFAIALVPVIVGAIFLITGFDWMTLGLVVILLLAASVGNSLVRGRLACKYCRQRLLGCPAERLFNKGQAAVPEA